MPQGVADVLVANISARRLCLLDCSLIRIRENDRLPLQFGVRLHSKKEAAAGLVLAAESLPGRFGGASRRSKGYRDEKAGRMRAGVLQRERHAMTDYQIDARRIRKNELKVGYEGEVSTFRRKSWFIQNMVGTVGRDAYQMKLPAPWTGNRYKLEQDGRELASASKPKFKQHIVTFELELAGRQLLLVSQDRHGLRYVLSEGGNEVGSYDQRDFDDQSEWTAEFHASREWSGALTTFVAWLVAEGRRMVN
jgi:hypothetical protein